MRLKGKLLAIFLVFALIFSALPMLVLAGDSGESPGEGPGEGTLTWFITPPTQKTYIMEDPVPFSFAGLTVTAYDDQKNPVTLSYENFDQPLLGEYVTMSYDSADFLTASVYVAITYKSRTLGFILNGIAPENVIDSFTVETLRPQLEARLYGYYIPDFWGDLVFTLNYIHRPAETYTYYEIYEEMGFYPELTPNQFYGPGTHIVNVELMDKTASFQVEILEYDPLDYFGNASTLTADTATVAGIYEPGGHAYYKFTPTVSGVYTFYSTDGNDTYGYLYDSNKQVITFDDDGGYGKLFRISYSLIAGMQYYYSVRFFEFWETGDISLVFESHSTFFEKLQSAPSLALNSTIESEISQYGDFAYYKFTPAISGNYSLTAFSSQSSLISVNLYDSEGAQITGGGINQNIDSYLHYLNADTQYYYSVRLGSRGETGDISVTLKKHTDSFFEALGDIPTLTLNASKTVTAYKTNAYSTYLKFIATESGYYTFRSEASTGLRFSGYVYDSFGQNIVVDSDYRGADYNFSVTCYLEAGMPYCCGARFEGSMQISFPVVISKFVDTISASRQLTVNSSISESFQDPGNFSYLSFTPSVSGVYDFYFYHRFSSNNAIFCAPYHASGKQITHNSSWDYTSVGPELRSVSCYLEAGEQYYFGIGFSYASDYPGTIPITFESGAVPSNFDSGDVNRDGEVNANDLTSIKEQLLFGNRMTDRQKALADHDGSGTVDVADLVRIKKAMVK